MLLELNQAWVVTYYRTQLSVSRIGHAYGLKELSAKCYGKGETVMTTCDNEALFGNDDDKMFCDGIW